MIEGEGSLTADGNVTVGDGRPTRPAPSSSPPARSRCAIPGVEFGDRVVDTWGAWSLPELPKRIAVVGAGRLGRRDRLRLRPLRHRGDAGRDAATRSSPPRTRTSSAWSSGPSRSRASTILTGTPISDVEAGEKSVKAKVGDEALEVDYLCIAGGRAPDTEALGLDAAGVKTGEDGKVEIDEFQRTSNPKIYAIGDLVRGPGARPQGPGGGRRRGRDDRRRPDPSGRPRTWSPARPSATRRSRASGMTEAAGEGGGQGGQGRQVQARRRSAPRPSTTTATGSSRSSPTPSTARSSAPTSSATAPAT